MLGFASIASLLLAAAPVLAAPAWQTPPVHCSLSSTKLTLPANQTELATPATAPAFIGLGVGVQNYTCNSTSLKYTLFGAVAELFDLSCLYSEPSFVGVQDAAYIAWTTSPSSLTSQSLISILGTDPAVLGQHFYVPNPAPTPGASATSPAWDFRADVDRGNANAFVVGARVGDLPAPTGPTDIDWVQLKEVTGQLAPGGVYRTDTRGGQPPASCAAGSAPISVKYVAKYWLFA